jgi:membrane protease YdiL (CAAX protease family)
MKTPFRTFLLFFLLFYLVWLVRATVFYSAVDLSIPEGPGRWFFSNGVKFLLWVLPAAAYLLWLERDNPLTSMKITTRLDRRGLAIGSVVTLLFFVAIFTFEKFTSGRTLAALLQAAPAAWLGVLGQVFFSPIVEETMFRGFVLPQLAARMDFWKANLLQALLFTAMHWPNWIWTNGLGPGLLSSSMGVFAIALLFGWLLKRTNSLWPPVIVHIINNFLVSFMG